MYLICQCNVIILCKVFSIVFAVRMKFREFGLGTMSVFNNLKTSKSGIHNCIHNTDQKQF